ncbi:hypothetical protein KHQ89_07815 [Mycoplasmatota bacterium]|nr:hypothetical protein KHQ89_07815 [Mycoplasmatota bacterium]
MKLSRSGYYKWLSRKGTLNQYDQNRKTLKKMIIDIHRSIQYGVIETSLTTLEKRQDGKFQTYYVINAAKH